MNFRGDEDFIGRNWEVTGVLLGSYWCYQEVTGQLLVLLGNHRADPMKIKVYGGGVGGAECYR